MSQVVDTKVVEMQFDNSKFEKNIEVSINSLKNLNKSVDDAGKGRNSLNDLAKAGDNLGLSFDNMNVKSRISLNMMDMLAGVGTKAFNKISDAVAGFALNMANSLSGMQAMRDGFAEYELKMGSIQTILAGAKIVRHGKELKDEAARLEVVNQKLQDLNTYSDKTIYSFKDMTSNIGKFTNAGVNLDDSVAAIQGVANVAAISGANANEASRAMYNFSQALAQGSVKLIDWKSINNANMGTVAFKQQLLDTALALKTVRQEGDHYISTTTDMNGKVSDAITSTKGFEESLSHQWLTTEVLTQTLKNYATDVREMTSEQLEDYKKSLLDIGYTSEQVATIIETSKKAFESATEVKTFTQMIDTLKESLGSGWAQTWEIVLGDFNEAKALWTGLNNTIDGLLSPIGKARNAILQLWKDDGGRDALIQSFKNLYQTVVNLVSPVKELFKALTPNTSHTGKILSTITKWIEKLTAVIAKATGLIGKGLSVILKPFIFVANYIGKQLIKLVGVFSSAFAKIYKFFAPVRTAVNRFAKTFADAFGKKVASRVNAFKETISNTLDDLKKRLKDSKTLKNLIEALKHLKEIVQDLFGIIMRNASVYASRFVTYLTKIWKAIAPLVSSAVVKVLKNISDFILPKLRRALTLVIDKIKELGNFINSLDIKNSRFYKGLVKLPEAISNLANNSKIKSFFSAIKNFATDALTFLSDKFKNLKTNLDSIKMPKGLTEVFENIKNFIKSIFGKDSVDDSLTETMDKTGESVEKIADSSSGQKLTAFQKFLEGVSNAFEWLAGAARTAKSAIEKFVNFVISNTLKAFKALYDFMAGDDGILTIGDISEVVYEVSDALSMLLMSLGFSEFSKTSANISDAIGDISEEITILLKRVGNKLKMSALKDFAIAIGVTAGALFLLAQVPWQKLAVAGPVLIGLMWALSHFFDTISSGSMDLSKTAGNLSISALLIGIGAAMIGLAASVGILVGALAVFPKVIKSYNNLGDEFKTGMERVKEVLTEIFEYLDHLVGAKFGLRGAAAILGLVLALDRIRKVIVKYANKKTGEAMEDGLNRIKQVLGVLGDFLNSSALSSLVGGFNIGINFNYLGIAAIIWALGDMINKITEPIKQMAALSPGEFAKGFGAVELIFFEFGAFLMEMAVLSRATKTSLGQWIGMAANVLLVASAISSIVNSLETLTKLAKDPAHFTIALIALAGVFAALSGVLYVIGKMEPKASITTLFGLSLAVGALTACVVALTPLAAAKPGALMISVVAVGLLMLALGGALYFVSQASGKTTVADIFNLLAMTFALVLLANALRRLARVGDPNSITTAALAIGVAAFALAGAMTIINGLSLNPLALIGLALLAAAIRGVAFAIHAFRSSTGEMKDGMKEMSDSTDEAAEVMGVQTDKLAAIAKDVVPQVLGDLFKNIGPKIRDAIKNFDLGSYLREKFEQLKADAKNWAQDFIDIGTNLMEGIATALENPANIERIKTCMINLGKALVDAFKSFLGIASPSTVMIEQGGYVIDGLVQGLMEYPSKLAGWAQGIGQFILNSISNLAGYALEKGREFVDSIATGIQNGKAAVSKAAHAVGKFALDKVGKAKDWAKRASAAVSSYAARIRAGASQAKGAAAAMVNSAIAQIKPMASHFAKSAATAVSNLVGKLRAGVSKAKAQAKAMVEGAKSAFNGIGSAFRTFGVNAAQGFRNGINSMISRIAAKAREMVRAAKNAAKSEQNSNSPSKDFMEYGGWAADGYALGLVNRKSSKLIENNARKMVNAAKNVASATSFGVNPMYLDSNPAMRSLAYAMGQISDTLDESVNTSPTIRPVIDMSNVNRNASAISSLFGDQSIAANIDAATYAQKDFNRTMAARNDILSSKSIDALANRISGMTDTMNNRQIIVNATVEGSENPEVFADRLIRRLQLKARAI